VAQPGGRQDRNNAAALRETLLELVDFDLIDQANIHFAVGAVNVLTGNFLYFDNKKEVIEPEHVMASGALLPALPMVSIGTDHFWDGGIVSNTPLQHLLDQDDRRNSLVFQVDLFSARGVLPRDVQEVLSRHKDIMYSSRTRHNTDIYKPMNNLKAELYRALQKIRQDQWTDKERHTRDRLAHLPRISILHLIYQQRAYEAGAKGTTSQAPRCASIGRAGSRTRGEPRSARNGWRCPKRARPSWCTTYTANGIIERLPQRLPRPLRPGAVVLPATDPVLTHLGKDLPRRRQRPGIDALVGIPQVGAHDRACALEIDLLDRHDDDRARRLAIHLEAGEQRGIGRHMGAAVDAQRAAGARNKEQQRHSRVAHDVA
jgi:Patatin phospholipase